MDGAVLDPKFDILPDVLATIKKHNMLQPGVSVVVGGFGVKMLQPMLSWWKSWGPNWGFPYM